MCVHVYSRHATHTHVCIVILHACTHILTSSLPHTHTHTVDAVANVKTVKSNGKTVYPIGNINILKSHGKSIKESVLVDGYALNMTRTAQVREYVCVWMCA
jgi:chaperonin GroEL (HSP60 family)